MTFLNKPKSFLVRYRDEIRTVGLLFLDVVRGASLVVWAIRDGREAGAEILRYLGGVTAVAAE